MNEYIILIFSSCLATTLLWWFYSFEYTNYRTELLRHRLFLLRDDLFASAMNGDISFESKAYGMTRITLNGMIRMSHKLNLLNFFITKLVYSKEDFENIDRSFIGPYKEAIDELKMEEKKIILRAFVRAHICILSHIIHTSLILLPFAIILKPFHVINLSDRNFLIRGKEARKKWLYIDATANSIGNQISEGFPQTA